MVSLQSKWRAKYPCLSILFWMNCQIYSYKQHGHSLTSNSDNSLFFIYVYTTNFARYHQMNPCLAKGMKTLLLIDDSNSVRDRLVEMISTLSNIQIIGQACDGREGVSIFNNRHPDLVILDIQMPGLNGIDVLRSIKKTNPETVIFILTNFPYPQYRDICMKAGADYFFDKSNEFEKVVDVLQSSP